MFDKIYMFFIRNGGNRMSEINLDTVKHVANLARIEIQDEKAAVIAGRSDEQCEIHKRRPLQSAENAVRRASVNIHEMTVETLYEKIQSKEIKPSEVVGALFDRIEASDETIGSFLFVDKEEAMKQAEALDQLQAEDRMEGPLFGIPMGIKDNICTKDVLTTCASRMLEDFIPVYDATVMEWWASRTWMNLPWAAPIHDDLFESLGATVEEVSIPHTKYVVSAYYLIASSEASSNLARFDGIRYGYKAEGTKTLEEHYKKTRSEGFGEEVKRRIFLGTFVLSAGHYDQHYIRAQKLRRPIGLQLIGNHFDEKKIYNAALKFEEQFNLHEELKSLQLEVQ